MFTSEAVTRGVRVPVQSEYAPDRSHPTKRVVLPLHDHDLQRGDGDVVQLMTRHWIITDGTGHVEEVRGPGVVGKQPTLRRASRSSTRRGARCRRRSA